MRRVIFNKKGGVGKTSITCNLAAIAARRGKRVLVVDLDSQGNTTQYLMGEHLPAETVADYFDQSGGLFSTLKPARDFVVSTPFDNVSLMPGGAKLQDVEHKLEQRYKIQAVKKMLDELEPSYDEIYIDTPPALGFYTKAALIGGNNVLIPFDCDAFSRHSLDIVAQAVSEIRDDHNDKLKVEGIIVNNFQSRARLPQELVSELRDSGYPLLESMLGTSVKMRESHQMAMPLVYCAPSHGLTLQFEALYDELEGKR